MAKTRHEQAAISYLAYRFNGIPELTDNHNPYTQGYFQMLFNSHADFNRIIKRLFLN